MRRTLQDLIVGQAQSGGRHARRLDAAQPLPTDAPPYEAVEPQLRTVGPDLDPPLAGAGPGRRGGLQALFGSDRDAVAPGTAAAEH